MKDAFSTVAGIVKGAAQDAVRGTSRLVRATVQVIRARTSQSDRISARKDGKGIVAPQPAALSTPVRSAATGGTGQLAAGKPVGAEGGPPPSAGTTAVTPAKAAAPAKAATPAKAAAPAKAAPAKKTAAAKKTAPAKKTAARKSRPDAQSAESMAAAPEAAAPEVTRPTKVVPAEGAKTVAKKAAAKKAAPTKAAPTKAAAKKAAPVKKLAPVKKVAPQPPSGENSEGPPA